LSGKSRNGGGAPIASGLKKLRGSFMRRFPASTPTVGWTARHRQAIFRNNHGAKCGS
jgi:hypothetical protein